jgi:hypothetical protein
MYISLIPLLDLGILISIILVRASILLGIARMTISNVWGRGMMVDNLSMYNFSLLGKSNSVYQSIVSANNPLKKGALEKFVDYIRDQAHAVQVTSYFEKFVPLLNQMMEEPNKTKEWRSLKKAEVIARYNDFLEHIQSQLDILG